MLLPTKSLKRILFGLACLLSVSVCRADLMITGFSATNEDESTVWQGFGFQVTGVASLDVSGFGIIDINAAGIVAAEARLWEITGPGAYTQLAQSNFVGGTAEDLATSAAFQYAGATPGLAVNGFRLANFAGGDVTLNSGSIYIIAARSSHADPFNPGSDPGLEFFQSVTGSGVTPSGVTVGSPFDILSSFAAADNFSGGFGTNLSTNYYGLQGFEQVPFPGNVNTPPFNSIADTSGTGGFAFNPISVNLFTGTIEDNTPTDPVVPEPSSMLLMALAMVGGGVVLHGRKQVSDS